MKFHEIKTLTGELIFTRTRSVGWPTIPVLAASAFKPSPHWQLAILWFCRLIGRSIAHRGANNRVPLRYKLVFLAIIVSIVIPVLVEKLRF